MEANQLNARRSTGPKTAAGKARSRMNALRHGLTASSVVIPGEDAHEFELLRAELVGHFAPRCALEMELVERLAVTLWRLRRVPIYEAAVLRAREVQCEELGRLRRHLRDGGCAPQLGSLGESLIHDANYGDAVSKLGRHETNLVNTFEKTLSQLTELQATPQRHATLELLAA
ncbi:hypothetical protein [Methyloceanibacter sp. wino2]|uniref:hypothetical protein n=1 Tax=Methyloceanibacter sp. wino2 TaxID=2170729 RepID=UPI000D3E2BEA|nr:hypothetical protein [Methyloceanibacter sp. wino2]